MAISETDREQIENLLAPLTKKRKKLVCRSMGGFGSPELCDQAIRTAKRAGFSCFTDEGYMVIMSARRPIWRANPIVFEPIPPS